jgi:hypothetical protein
MGNFSGTALRECASRKVRQARSACSASGTAPLPTRTPARRSSHLVTETSCHKDNADDTKDQIKWKLSKGDAVTLGEFLDPVNGSAVHHLCIYDGSGATQPLLEAIVPSGGTCNGTACWKPAGTIGFKYKNKAATPNGITDEKLKSGIAGKSQVQVKAKGVLIAMPTLPLTTPVTVQLVITDGITTSCWQTSFPSFTANTPQQFKAKGP